MKNTLCCILIILIAVLVSACSSGGEDDATNSTVDDNSSTPSGESSRDEAEDYPLFASASSNEDGNVSLTVAGYQINVSTKDNATHEAVSGVLVKAAALTDSVLVWTEDASGEYSPYSALVPFSDLSRVDESTQTRLAVTSLAFGLLTAYELASAWHEVTTDPPAFYAIQHDGKIQKTCAALDINDGTVIASIFTAVKHVPHLYQVFIGSAKTLRGVTAMNAGFNFKNLLTDFIALDLVETINHISDLFSKDWEICIPSVHGETLPFIQVIAHDRDASFEITEVDFPEVITIQSAREGYAYSLVVRWDGDPAFPLTAYIDNIDCDSSWTCAPEQFEIENLSDNNYERGCLTTGDPAASLSADFTYSIVLTDVDGLTTSPKEFSYTCIPPG